MTDGAHDSCICCACFDYSNFDYLNLLYNGRRLAPRRRKRPLWPLFHWHVRGPVRVARGSSCDWHSVLTSESDRPLTVARHRDRRGLRVLLANAGTTRAGRAVHAATCAVAAARGVAEPTQPGTPGTRVNACAADNALTVMQAAPLQQMRLHSNGSSVRVCQCIDPSRTLLLVG